MKPAAKAHLFLKDLLWCFREEQAVKTEILAGLRVDFLVPGRISSFSLDNHSQQTLADDLGGQQVLQPLSP